MVEIREGGFYRTRDGRKVGPARPADDYAYGLGYKWSLGVEWYYQDNGIAGNGTHEPHDLIAEWTDEPASPIREITRKEIVPGVYGVIEIWKPIELPGDSGRVVDIEIIRNPMSESELEAAASVFMQIAAALREGEK